MNSDSLVRMRQPLLKHNPHAPATPTPDLGDLDYRVQGLLATDSKMSEILLATDPKGQTVILKIACVQQRVRAEANRRAIHNSVLWLQQIRDHAGIAQLQPIRRKSQRGLRAWFTPPTFITTLPDWPEQPNFLISEYLAGGTLNSFVGKRPLPVDLALSLAYELAQTVAYLHEHQCVHRDLKPENVLFRTPPAQTSTPGTLQPVLIDFGVAARSGEAKLIAGSRLWMAPELQAANEKSLLPVDPAWDVYALGLICCYMLSGRRPVRRQHNHQDYIDYREQVCAFLQQEAAGADAAWQEVVSSLQKLLQRTLDRDPRRRPTAAALAAMLATLLLSMGITPTTKQVRPVRQWYAPMLPHWQSIQKHGRWLGLVGLLILGYLFLTAILDSQAFSDVTAPASPVSTPAPPASTLTVPSLVTAAATAQPNQEIKTTLATPPPTATLPPPTLVPLPTMPPQAIPTVGAKLTNLTLPPPTLAPLPPTPEPTATAATDERSTATATVLLPPRAAPPSRPLPSATPPPTVRAFAVIRLHTPLPNVSAADERVEFAWEATGAPLASDQCYELVFWDPAQSRDKRSPIGAGRATKGLVNFHKLSNSADPLLQALARSSQGFAWGVRFVSCTSPETVLQDVNAIRHYTYQP